eukprot:414816-Rhodomonas_salina.1
MVHTIVSGFSDPLSLRRAPSSSTEDARRLAQVAWLLDTDSVALQPTHRVDVRSSTTGRAEWMTSHGLPCAVSFHQVSDKESDSFI